MALTTLSSILQGGDRRSLGEANRVVTLVLGQPRRFPELLECLWCDDPVVRMRAADAAEKISAQRAELPHPFKAELLGRAGETSQQELRWHLALMIPRLPLAPTERKRAIALLKEFLSDRSSIVKTCALQGLAELAQGIPELRSEVIGVMERASRTGTPAMKACARKLLPKLRGRTGAGGRIWRTQKRGSSSRGKNAFC
jgi:hypothetical protein